MLPTILTVLLSFTMLSCSKPGNTNPAKNDTIKVTPPVTPPAASTRFYCDPANGSVNNNGSQQSPWADLASVLAKGTQFKANDTIYLLSGNHGSPIINTVNGSNVTILSAAGHTPTAFTLKVKGVSNWKISGLQINLQPSGTFTKETLVSVDDKCTKITIEKCEISTTNDISNWTDQNWMDRASNGITSHGTNCSFLNNKIRNIKSAIEIGRAGSNTIIRDNVIENFSGDGMRLIADDIICEYNIIRNGYRVDPVWHYDFIQMWSLGGANGNTVGEGVIKGHQIRGNILISYTDPNQPYKGGIQGIGNFDGFSQDFVIENNIVITGNYNGIVLLGATNCNVTNNTVLRRENTGTNTPYISIQKHKNGSSSTGNFVRNNIVANTASSSIEEVASRISSNNIVISDFTLYPNYFVDPANLNFRLKAGSPAVNAGTQTGAPTIDFEKQTRNLPIDVGADELN